MTEFIDVNVNDKWPMKFPRHIGELPMWKFWEKERMAAMYHAIRPDDVILDIGTCNGDMSAVFASWVKPAQIILVEPSPDFWPLIKAIFDENGLKPLDCYQVVVGDKTDPSFDYYIHGDIERELWPKDSENEIKLETGFMHLNEHPDSIPAVRIDEMYLPKIDIITMDIEGSEYEALAGAEEVLLKDRPIVFVSIHPEFMWREHHHSPDDLIHMMQKFGYDATYLAFDHEQHWIFKPKP